MSLVPYHEAIQRGGNSYDGIGPGGLRSYASRPYQRGMGLGKTITGFFKSLESYAKKAAVALGKNALEAGAAVAQDALDRKDIKTSLKNNLKSAGLGFSRDLISEFVAPSKTVKEKAGPNHSISPNKSEASKRPRVRAARQSVKAITKQKKRPSRHQDIFD